MQHNSLTLDEELKFDAFLCMYPSYKPLKTVQFLAHPVCAD